MLDSCFQANINKIDVLLFKVATFLPALVEISEKLRERNHIFDSQDGCWRHFEDLASCGTAILRTEF